MQDINTEEKLKLKRGRQWEEGVDLYISESFFCNNGDSRISIADRVYIELRRMILNNFIAPKQWLRQDILTKNFGVSSTPVREALRSLERVGLVNIIPNYGVQVSDLSIEEFEEIYALRKGLEGLAARRSVLKLSLEKQSEFQDLFNALLPLAKQDTLNQYLKEEWAFRYWLYQRCKRTRFLSQILDLRERAERYLKFAYIDENSINVSLEYHRKLLWACEKRNPDKAELLVQKMLTWTLETASPVIADNLKREGRYC